MTRSSSASASARVSDLGRMASRVGALAAAALLFALCLSAPAAAQKSKLEPVSIAVIDFQGVLRSCEAAKDIRTQIDAKRAGLQQTFGETERKLRQDEQALTQQRAILSPYAFQAKAKEFKERVAGVQRDAQSRKRQLDKAFAQAMEQVRVELIKQVAELAREPGVGADYLYHHAAVKRQEVPELKRDERRRRGR